MSEVSLARPVSPAGHELDELLAGVRIYVDLAPGSGLNTSGDWWAATLDALGVGAVGYGVDDALDELTRDVRAEIAMRLEAYVRESELGLVLRLWLADRRGELREVLGASGRVADFAANGGDQKPADPARSRDEGDHEARSP